MAIEQINAVQLLGSLTKPERTAPLAETVTSFDDFLKESISQVVGTETQVKNDVVSLVTGSSDALHNITINAAKADLAIQTLVSVRNKALEAYNEIMRITL